MISLTSVVVLLAVAALVYTWRAWYCRPLSKLTIPETGIESLRALNVDHELRTEFLKLVREDGAGSWPPVARHDGWPAALSAYRKVYAQVAPFLASAEPSLDDDFNVKRCAEFRARMRASLEQHVDTRATASCLQSILDGNWAELSRDSFNGFYSCVACLRHAYRWATNPVVRVAQNEKQLAFPFELDLAWSFIQKHLDITSPSGNIMANIICNFDDQGKLTYQVNEGMSESVQRTELAWCKIFTDSETLATPMYCGIIQAMMSYQRGDKKAALAYTEAVFEHVRKLILHLYNNMNEPNVSRAIWVRHVSGIHSWGLTSDSEHGPVEYGGLSGSQTLIFLAMDAFIGVPSYHSEDEIKMHICKNMRNVFAAMKRHCFRPKLEKGGSAEDLAIIEVMDRIVKQMRTFRGVHKVRAVRFLSAPAPERVPMTAALSVLDEREGKEKKQETEEGAYASIDGLLTKRLNQTI
ncbi:Indoleamine 2,3-dioxygenase [Cordyceps javanica]|uniref:Indoleamine 2,3-dioxygenase n=1 Tax=Cordyceps javanica TaxID=43265 RepID=A0A545VLQ5_9HYPO|nr:Indoleamine 2,3-dioxygenase [Cordyceps javanica]TQW02620.1 Indoleamine 2,3-dioxygenase [Cordyceps javanica]